MNRVRFKTNICIFLLEIIYLLLSGCCLKEEQLLIKINQHKYENKSVQIEAKIESIIDTLEVPHMEDKIKHSDYSLSVDYKYIEKDHEILEYNICSLPNYDYIDTILEEYLRKDVEEDKEMCEKLEILSPLEIDYFKFDFNADGLEDYLVCYHGYLWSGSGGNAVRIYIQETDNTLKNEKR